LYRTGDRARWRADGTLEFLGRLDDQTKIRGYRVEPGEIASCLRTCAGVRDARVMADDGANGTQLVAYVAGDADVASVRAHLQARLPRYMVPSAIVVLARLPVTVNGKPDIDALRALARTAADERYVAPQTPVEEALARIWSDVLGASRIGAADDFFALGGHSLLVMQLTTHVQAAFGIDLPIRAVFETPTLQALAGEVERLVYDSMLAMSDDDAETLSLALAAAPAC
jgi:acyl carrier protein